MCLDKIASKNGVKYDPINRPWWPASSYGCYGAPLPAIKHTTSTNIIRDGSASLKLEKTLIITLNMTTIACRVDDDVLRRRNDDKTMGTVRPAGRI